MDQFKELKCIYLLHGFASAPKYPSDKADALEKVFKLPVRQLAYDSSATFADNFEKLKAQITVFPQYFVGTSLGAFYASKLSELLYDEHAAETIMLNPCHNPYEMLAYEVGEHTNFVTAECFTFSQEALDSYQSVPFIDESKSVGRWVLINMDDELIDSRDTKKLYDSKLAVITFEHGGHRFKNISDNEVAKELLRIENTFCL